MQPGRMQGRRAADSGCESRSDSGVPGLNGVCIYSSLRDSLCYRRRKLSTAVFMLAIARYSKMKRDDFVCSLAKCSILELAAGATLG